MLITFGLIMFYIDTVSDLVVIGGNLVSDQENVDLSDDTPSEGIYGVWIAGILLAILLIMPIAMSVYDFRSKCTGKEDSLGFFGVFLNFTLTRILYVSGGILSAESPADALSTIWKSSDLKLVEAISNQHQLQLH